MTARGVLMDVSRLFARRNCPAPTGIDRVEWAYANHLVSDYSGPVSFCRRWAGRFWSMPEASVTKLLGVLDRRWHGAPRNHAALAQALDWPALAAGDPEPTGTSGANPRPHGRGQPHPTALPPVLLNVSHHNLDRPALLSALKARTGGPFAVFLHDAIPIQFPEYCRNGDAAKHRRRLKTVEQLADLVLVNSVDTGRVLRHVSPGLAARSVPLQSAPLWCEAVFRPQPTLNAPEHPYFLCVGTIEARKNHTLLLSLWRALTAELGAACPKLVLVGKRGWENDTALALLERCPDLQTTVLEAGPVDDTVLSRLMAGARALLMPSFAEGFGLPVIEAMATRTPIIASDLAALREVGGVAPEYLSPLDGAGWRQAVIDYTDRASERRSAQMARLADLPIRSPDEHFAQVFNFLDKTFAGHTEQKLTPCTG